MREKVEKKLGHFFVVSRVLFLLVKFLDYSRISFQWVKMDKIIFFLGYMCYNVKKRLTSFHRRYKLQEVTFNVVKQL